MDRMMNYDFESFHILTEKLNNITCNPVNCSNSSISSNTSLVIPVALMHVLLYISIQLS